jgi:hypothetical protein
MKLVRTVLTCLCVGLFTMVRAQAQEWHGIVLLQSTRADVERLLGPPTETDKNQYRVDQDIVNVRYSMGLCNQGDRRGWNVPRDTVIGLSIYLKVPHRLSECPIDESDFLKVKDPHMPGNFFHFVNYDKGIIIIVSEGLVRNFEYQPSAKHKDLDCAEVNKRR